MPGVRHQQQAVQTGRGLNGGRDARAIQGNFGLSMRSRPFMEMDVRAIPGSHRYVATAAAHHAGNNPDVGYINEEMVHNGLMNNAADQGYWNEPWSEVQTDLDPPGTTNQNMLGEQTQNGRD